ncbi:uncharacterized protein LOC108669304 [Hyalella azteca]|uniref:Uncharacterized protein LOC108669304 n=1 Tax=Hyalella azteca TaxID=294128 RepID=A0A8B7NER0_HYAAZ|nr:uncharacterized protein LOC108669304 [Hyalella azteca]
MEDNKVPTKDELSCDVCLRQFDRKSRLVAHYKTHTGERPFRCPYCSKSFASKGNCNTHVRVHTRERPYVCQHCGKQFSQHGQMVIHVRRHTGEKPYVCSHCKKGFACSKVLKIHVRTHTGEKPYVCDFCSKGFAAYANLVVHRRIHTRERPYSCKLCGRSFEHSGNLIRHERGHHVDGGIRCIPCGRLFQETKDLVIHMNDSHPNEVCQEDVENQGESVPSTMSSHHQSSPIRLENSLHQDHKTSSLEDTFKDANNNRSTAGVNSANNIKEEFGQESPDSGCVTVSDEEEGGKFHDTNRYHMEARNTLYRRELVQKQLSIIPLNLSKNNCPSLKPYNSTAATANILSSPSETTVSDFERKIPGLAPLNMNKKSAYNKASNNNNNNRIYISSPTALLNDGSNRQLNGASMKSLPNLSPVSDVSTSISLSLRDDIHSSNPLINGASTSLATVPDQIEITTISKACEIINGKTRNSKSIIEAPMNFQYFSSVSSSISSGGPGSHHFLHPLTSTSSALPVSFCTSDMSPVHPVTERIFQTHNSEANVSPMDLSLDSKANVANESLNSTGRRGENYWELEGISEKIKTRASKRRELEDVCNEKELKRCKKDSLSSSPSRSPGQNAALDPKDQFARPIKQSSDLIESKTLISSIKVPDDACKFQQIDIAVTNNTGDTMNGINNLARPAYHHQTKDTQIRHQPTPASSTSDTWITRNVKSFKEATQVSQTSPKAIGNIRESIRKSLSQICPVQEDRKSFKLNVETALMALVGKSTISHLGHPNRNVEQVLVNLLDVVGMSPCADVRVDEDERLRVNMRKLLEYGLPEPSAWRSLGWHQEAIEAITAKIASWSITSQWRQARDLSQFSRETETESKLVQPNSLHNNNLSATTNSVCLPTSTLQTSNALRLHSNTLPSENIPSQSNTVPQPLNFTHERPNHLRIKSDSFLIHREPFIIHSNSCLTPSDAVHDNLSGRHAEIWKSDSDEARTARRMSVVSDRRETNRVTATRLLGDDQTGDEEIYEVQSSAV